MTICINHLMLVRLDTEADIEEAYALAEAFAAAELGITITIVEEPSYAADHHP